MSTQKTTTTRRRADILEAIRTARQIRVADLSRQFGISQVAMRNHLDYLENLGLIQRTHGGARPVSPGAQSLVFDARLLTNLDIKRALGAAAARLIQNGETIFLDSGTTVLQIAHHLPAEIVDEGSLTVVARSLAIAAALRRHRQVRLVLLGGVYAPDFDTFTGAPVESALKELHVNTLFMGSDGISEQGISTDNLLEAGLFRSMAACAEKIVLVADASKIGVHRLQTVLPLSAIHTLITEASAPSEFIAALRNRDIQVQLVQT